LQPYYSLFGGTTLAGNSLLKAIEQNGPKGALEEKRLDLLQLLVDAFSFDGPIDTTIASYLMNNHFWEDDYYELAYQLTSPDTLNCSSMQQETRRQLSRLAPMPLLRALLSMRIQRDSAAGGNFKKEMKSAYMRFKAARDVREKARLIGQMMLRGETVDGSDRDTQLEVWCIVCVEPLMELVWQELRIPLFVSADFVESWLSDGGDVVREW
jgi:hypothetical protein